MSPKRLKLVVALGLILPGLLLAAGALAINLQLEYPKVPGADKTLNDLVEDKLVAMDCATEDCKLVPGKVIDCKEVDGKLIAGKLATGENGVAKVCKVVPAQFTIPDIFIFLFQAAIWIGVILAFFSLVYIGFRFATSGGDPIRLKGAKARLRGIAFGILVLIGSFLLLRLINPELTALRFVQKGVCSGDKCKNPTGFDLKEEAQSTGSAGGLTVYSESGFAGNAVNILTDIPEAQKQLVGSGGLSSANGSSGVLLRSLKLAPNCTIRLYEKPNYNGGENSQRGFIEVVNNGQEGRAVSAYYDIQSARFTQVPGVPVIVIPLDESKTLLFSRIDDLKIDAKGNEWGDDIDSIKFITDGLEGARCENRRGVVFYDSATDAGPGRREAFWNDEENFKTTFIGNDSASFMKIVGNVDLTVYDDAPFKESSKRYETKDIQPDGSLADGVPFKNYNLIKEKWYIINKDGVITDKDEDISDKISSLKISFPIPTSP